MAPVDHLALVVNDNRAFFGRGDSRLHGLLAWDLQFSGVDVGFDIDLTALFDLLGNFGLVEVFRGLLILYFLNHFLGGKAGRFLIRLRGRRGFDFEWLRLGTWHLDSQSLQAVLDRVRKEACRFRRGYYGGDGWKLNDCLASLSFSPRDGLFWRNSLWFWNRSSL